MLLLGIDLGQSAVKATLVTAAGTVVASASRPCPVSHPHPGWVEQDPDAWVTAAADACHRLWAEVPRDQVAAVGLSSATHHGVLLDAKLRPVRPSIMLTDGRSAEVATALDAAHGDRILAVTRNTVSATWTLAHLAWLAEHEPDTLARTRTLVFAKDYLRLRLTGELATDWIEAEGSLLWDVGARRWDDQLAGLAGLRADQLPPVFDPSAPTGAVSAEGEQATGIPAGTPVIAGCSDTAAEAYAAGANQPGVAVVKIATAGNVNVVTDRPAPGRAVLTYTHPVPGLSYHSVATNSAVSSLDWWRRAVDLPDPEEATAEAAQAEPGAVLFHPYLLGERAPCWDPNLRATFLGVSATTTRGALTRAVLEGVALSLADCLDVLVDAGHRLDGAQIIGGGARSPLWRQITADVLGMPLTYPALPDASAGAALLAGAQLGGEGLVADPTVRPAPVAHHEPQPASHAGYRELLDVYRAARTALAPIQNRMREISFGPEEGRR